MLQNHKDIGREIDRINKKHGLDVVVESDYKINLEFTSKSTGKILKSTAELPALNQDNITKLLLDLQGLLDENSGYRIFIEECTKIARVKPISDYMLASDVLKHWFVYDDDYSDSRSPSDLNLSHPAKTQAKALADKWFSLREENGKATPSLWSTNPDLVLEELLEILKKL